MEIISILKELLQTGLGSLAAYLAAHVLLCLLPAFFIAGALSALVPKQAITKYLGRSTPKWLSYPVSAVGGFVLAVCSCTIMPLFASIYKKGAGLGPAITFLFVGPAINILAISLTGTAIGMDIALARIIFSIIFGIVIGLLMAWIFRDDDAKHDAATNNGVFNQEGNLPAYIWVLLVILLATLLAGTLQISLLKTSFATFTLPGEWVINAQSWLNSVVPPNPAMGIEGVTIHGVLLICLLIAISLTALKGLENLENGFTRWTFVTLGLISITVVIASLSVVVMETGLKVGITGRFVAETAMLASIWWLSVYKLDAHEIQEWLWEIWRFVKQIIPLLLVGVFIVGMTRAVIPAQWITKLAGRNTFVANLAGVLFGVFMYFPTLVEVPIAQTFLSLGMQRGPLLAYLLADPELSVQSILITNTVIGKKKTAVYVVLVTIFSTLAGWIFGWVVG